MNYPALPRCKCDLRVSLPDGTRIWIEIKGAWKQYWILQRREWIYQAYLLHPLVDGLDPKTHTVPLDLKRLASLTPADADVVACLLVGFDAVTAPMQPDIDRLQLLAGLSSPRWSEENAHWPDGYRQDEQTNCWLWWRPLKES